MANGFKGKVTELHAELRLARRIVKNILDSLESCDSNSNLTKKIGIYAQQMPQAKFLVNKRTACILCIRQVCTGEMSINEARKLFLTAEKQLIEALDCIKL